MKPAQLVTEAAWGGQGPKHRPPAPTSRLPEAAAADGNPVPSSSRNNALWARPSGRPGPRLHGRCPGLKIQRIGLAPVTCVFFRSE